MKKKEWFEIISRVTMDEPLFMEEGNGKPVKPSVSLSSDPFLATQSLPTEIFSRTEPGTIAFGIRVSKPIESVDAVVLHLASLACERDVYPLIISMIDISGFEQFGFRVERISASNNAEADIQLEELKKFWNIALVVDVEDVFIMS